MCNSSMGTIQANLTKTGFGRKMQVNINEHLQDSGKCLEKWK